MKRELLIGIKLFLLLFSQVANAQVSVELSMPDNNKISPELYFMSKLEESIFAKHEGLKLTNLASVKFDVDKEGHVSNIAFSISTDSLLECYIVDALMSTDRKWIIRRDGKFIKSKVSIILPILFRLRPHTVKKISTRINEISGRPSENATWEQIHIFNSTRRMTISFYSIKIR